jgi:AmpD protein
VRAWHAGESVFAGRTNCNDFSIGIELEGCDDIAYETMQYEVLADLIKILMQTYSSITPERIVGHCDVAPGRKTDPGAIFDWELLQAQIASDHLSKLKSREDHEVKKEE